jgi:hypothetical protein
VPQPGGWVALGRVLRVGTRAAAWRVKPATCVPRSSVTAITGCAAVRNPAHYQARILLTSAARRAARTH